MDILDSVKKNLSSFKSWFFTTSFKDKLNSIKNIVFHSSLKRKIIALVIIIGIGFLAKQLIFNTDKNKISYETTKAEKGTLVTSISGSGTITSGNNSNINTKVSGVVNTVYITNGDTVNKGDKIAEVTLDDYAQERQTAAWVKYLEAVEAVKDVEKAKATADLQMWRDREAILDTEEDIDYKNKNPINPDTGKNYTLGEKTIIDKTLDEAQKAYAASEAKYKDADADITNAQAKVAAALRDYQENSATIIAPSTGVISNLTLAQGSVIEASSTTSNTSGATIISAQTIGKISNPDGQLIATVNLSEIDVVNVKANQKATLTLDAYSDKSFTGRVLSVNTGGNVSSGVTTYPVTVILDPVTVDIYPNMAVNATIITAVKPNVIMVPTTAITTANGQSTVQVKNGDKIAITNIEIGSANDTNTEIVSGIKEGDEVITATTDSTDNSQSSDTTSPFSGAGRSNSGSGNNNNFRIQVGGQGGF